nr:bifunctional adenosylcobinamide kinase/adenosylcobinamide-phosphate guanylyltransferase [Rhodoferax sp.]
MVEALTIARSELVLGGQKSGKSRRAELLARDWLAASPTHHAVLIATAQPWDDEMRQRIARHQADRAERVPRMNTVEEPLALAQAIAQHSRANTLLVVDCLTLWLTNWLMPASPHPNPLPKGEGTVCATLVEQAGAGTDCPLSLWERAGVRAPGLAEQTTALQEAIRSAVGPIVLVSNEIGLGVIPMGVEVRAFVDALGRLNQEMAQACTRVTLMAAGLPLTLKDAG